MPIAITDCLHIEVEKDTPGGDTYTVTTDTIKAKALCLRKIHHLRRPDNEHDWRCTKPAGYGTSHKGQGACKTHGGSDNKLSNGIRHGKHAVRTKSTLEKRIQEYSANRDALLDLSYELAAIKAIFKSFIEDMPDLDSDDIGIHLQRMTMLVGSIGTLVDKISKTESRNSITAAHVNYLQACIVDIFMKHIHDPTDRELAIAELHQRVSLGDVSTKKLPSVNI